MAGLRPTDDEAREMEMGMGPPPERTLACGCRVRDVRPSPEFIWWANQDRDPDDKIPEDAVFHEVEYCERHRFSVTLTEPTEGFVEP